MESPVRKIVVEISTSHSDGAGTAAPVYLCIGGREFRLSVADVAAFERGAESAFILGEGANVEFPDRNDPRLGSPLTVADILGNAAYVRFQPRNDRDDWNVASIAVRIHWQGERRAIRFAALDGPGQSLWLGSESGTRIYLTLGELDRLAFKE